MTTRHSGYIVTLEEDMREDDAQSTLAALRHIKGVVSVIPVEDESVAVAIGKERAASEFLCKLYEFARSIRD